MNSFSGTHPFNPACLIAAYEEALQGGYDPADLHDEAVEFAARAVETADAGNCPCCGDRFAEGEIPSGSRLTDCRCIPVCAGCGHREGIPIPIADKMGVWEWAATDEEMVTAGALAQEHLAVEKWRAEARQTTGFIAADSEGKPVLVTEDGAGPVSFPDTGGWAQYGYDDSADEEERRR